ncbi:MAG: Low conductance mechanosensitive channel YnaI [Candidatus Anoxychlamydiales bacterium]|nr:Low conductance mechanosensitive channel YnaI [Candidatus Anoxychlamydiales bacterium]
MKKFFLHDFVVTNYITILGILFIIAFLVVLSFVLMTAFRKIHPKFLESKRVWDDALIIAIYKPLLTAIWFVGLTYIIPIAGAIFTKDTSKFNFIEMIRNLGVVFSFLWFFIIFIRRIEKNLFNLSISAKKKVDKTSIRAVAQLLRLGTIIIAILIILQTFGIPISGIVAFGGASGLVVGFASKDLFTNFFGGLMLFLDRPFVIGDWIRSPDREIEGTVEYIGWRLTRIRTFDKRPLFIPNGIFTSIAVENPSRMQNRRIKTMIGLRYEDSFKVADILKEVEEMLKNHPDIDTSKTLFAHLASFSPSALEFLVYTYTKTTKWVPFRRIQQDVFLKIIEIIKKHGAQLAYPALNVHFDENSPIAKK